VLGEFSRVNLPLLQREVILSDAIIPIYIAFWLFTKPKTPQFKPATKKLISWIVAFIGIATLSLIANYNNFATRELAISSLYLIRFIEYAALFLITLNLTKEEKTAKKIFSAAIISAFLIALTGFYQLISLPDLKELAKESGYDPHINRLVGSWLDPNFISGYFAFIISIIVGVVLKTKNLRLRLYLGTTAIVLLIATFLTYSRSGYIALAIGIVVISVLRSRKLLIIVAIFASIGLGISERAQQRVGELVQSASSIFLNTAQNPDPTARLRIKSWQQSIELFQKQPLLGYGYNTLTYAKLNEGFVADTTIHSASGSDSSLLTIAATTGIFGLLTFLAIYILVLKKSFTNAYKKNLSKFHQGLGLGLFAGILSLIIHAIFVNSLLFPQILIHFWIMLGIMYSAKPKSVPPLQIPQK